MIDWVMKAEGVSFHHAVELLQADHIPSSLAAGSTGVVWRIVQSAGCTMGGPASA